MTLACPQCATPHEPAFPCPVCGSRSQRFPAGVSSRAHGRTAVWMQTPWGRLLIGVLLAQGLFYAIRHLVEGLLLALYGGPPTWDPVARFLFWQGVQLVALIPGMALAGSGQNQALLLGLLGGAASGVMTVLLQAVPAQEMGAAALYGQPILQALAGALAAWLGSRIWKPLAPPTVPGGVVRKAPAPRSRSLFAGPLAWFRIVPGAALAVAGALSASSIFEFVLEFGQGKLSTQSYLEDRVVTWEIMALAILLASAAAGANTPNGLKQGLAVGVLTAGVLIAFPRYHATPEATAVTLGTALGFSLLGGWFGSQILPPLVRRPRLRDAGTM
jgi:hypothetical protein